MIDYLIYIAQFVTFVAINVVIFTKIYKKYLIASAKDMEIINNERQRLEVLKARIIEATREKHGLEDELDDVECKLLEAKKIHTMQLDQYYKQKKSSIAIEKESLTLNVSWKESIKKKILGVLRLGI